MANDKPKPDHNPDGTRRIAMRFDANGDPILASCKSPDSHKQRALCMEPPRDVIPVVFVPGVAGTNLRLAGEIVWRPPNGSWSALGRTFDKYAPDLKELQRLWDPEKTAVDPRGDCEISDKTYWLTMAEAQRRGWGAVHALSYHEFLQKLEMTLNDQYVVTDKGAFLLPEIGLLQYLKGGCPERTREEKAAGKPDYAKEISATLKAWGRTPQPLSAAEIGKLEDYYYPVWAAGFNWLGDPELAARGVLERINTILGGYGKSKYFRHQGKVILVTHSMGGLIARRAAQMDGSKILGVVHAVCPLVGAAVFYRRMRMGQEGGDVSDDVTAAIMGNRQEEMTVQIGRSPGTFSLAPTRDYPPNWLRAYVNNKEVEDDLALSLPKSDPYKEIYSKTTDDVWWGMIDPAMLDPMEVMTKENNKFTPIEQYRNAIKLAREFHDKLKLYAHPETYGIYGTDNEKFKSFAYISWLRQTEDEGRFYSFTDKVMKDYGYTDKESRKIFETAKGGRPFMTEYGRGKTFANVPYKTQTIGIPFKLAETRNTAGDGTVPVCSGEMLTKLTPSLKEVFAISGYGHQRAFDNTYVYRATIYSIARIVQKAQPPKKS